MDAHYFSNEGELWNWCRDSAQGLPEIWLGLYKKVSRVPSISIGQAMDVALCFGWSESKWITVDKHRFCIRFTPRIPGKAWSPGTVTRFLHLYEAGMIQEAGLAAWEARDIAGTESLAKAWGRKKLPLPPGM